MIQKLFEDTYKSGDYDKCIDMAKNYEVDCGFIFSGECGGDYMNNVFRGLRMCKKISVEDVEGIYSGFLNYAIFGWESNEAIEYLELLGSITKYENYTQRTIKEIILLITKHPFIKIFNRYENMRFKLCKNIMRYDFDEQSSFDIFIRCMGDNDEMMMMLLFVNGKDDDLLRQVDCPYADKSISYMRHYNKYIGFVKALGLVMELDLDIDVKNIIKRNLFDVTFLKNN